MVLAARGSRNLDRGEEEIQDPALVRELRHRALSVHLKSLLAAVLATAVVLVIP